jgi:uncharacterized protein (TIGR03435 family)
VDSILSFAYGVHPKQIVGAPAWFATDRYDIDGAADAVGQPSLKQMQGMYRKILAERFGLALHHASRELAVYALAVGKNGTDGILMAKTVGDPEGLSSDSTGDFDGGQGSVKFTDTSMADFALVMQFYVDRPVADKTGLTGR